MKSPLKIAVLTSGHSRGSNFKAIHQYIQNKNLPYQIAFVMVTDQTAPITDYCRMNQIETIVYQPNQKMNDFLIETFRMRPCDLIVLAGFMRKISQAFLDSIQCPVINIHPALLPNYGGRGMYGSHVHQAVFQAGDKISGASVHFVSNEYDKGEIVLQQSVDITDCKSPDDIARKVLEIEHKIYGEAIEMVLSKDIL
ncbi:MAG TPA: phosphoribosylglycinamide formyltransferase [Candidatus Cloacimonadota bacterium]|nr:phosphoribosylglycinamide formyltransferase [Candidatus Cloacimonadota bacterium]HOD53112.1 phosphoribosylglycinamide formyltransferase [Candidatus Cloacimonadota bacterium]